MFLEYKSELIVGTDTDFPCQPKVKSIFKFQINLSRKILQFKFNTKAFKYALQR